MSDVCNLRRKLNMSQILAVGKNIACIISDFFNSGAETYFADFRLPKCFLFNIFQ